MKGCRSILIIMWSISFHFESVRHPRGGSLLERLGMGENSCVRRKRSASVPGKSRRRARPRFITEHRAVGIHPGKNLGWPESFSSTTFALHFSTLSTRLFLVRIFCAIREEINLDSPVRFSRLCSAPIGSGEPINNENSQPRHLLRRWEALLIPCSLRPGAIYRTLNKHINHF